MFAAHDVDILVEEIEGDGAAVGGSGRAFSAVVGRHGDMVGPEQAVDCAGAETGDFLAHGYTSGGGRWAGLIGVVDGHYA